MPGPQAAHRTGIVSLPAEFPARAAAQERKFPMLRARKTGSAPAPRRRWSEDGRQRRREQANDEAHSEEGGDKSRAGEERLEPVQGHTARRKFERGARAEGHRDHDDERRQKPKIGRHDERQQQPRRLRTHDGFSRRPECRVANNAPNMSATVTSTRVSERLEAPGQLKETNTSS